MTILLGECLTCEATIKRETNRPEEWMAKFKGKQLSVWCKCPNNHLSGFIFSPLGISNK